MSFTISLTIEENQVAGLLAMEDAVSAVFTQVITTSITSAVFQVLTELLKISCVPPKQIKNLLITADFLSLLQWNRMPYHKVGYIRYLPRVTDTPPVLHDSPLQRHVVTVTVDGRNGLDYALRKLKQEQPAVLAINPSFFSWQTLLEKEIDFSVKEILGPEIPVTLGTLFNKIGFTARENLLLVNSLLLSGVQNFYNHLRELLKSLEISAKIYTLRNNGMLMTESYIRKRPLYTVRALFAAELMSAAGQASLNNAVVIIERQNGIAIGVTENGLPILSQAPLEFRQVPLNLTHPLTRSIGFSKDSCTSSLREEIKETLYAMNPTEESRPVMITVSNKDLEKLLLQICQRLSFTVIRSHPLTRKGALIAPLSIEKEYYLTDYTGKKRADIQKRLLDKMRREAAEEGVPINTQWQTYCEERHIRYLPEQASLIRLGLYGPLP